MAGSDRLTAKARHYAVGTLLFNKGEPGNSMFVIRKGRVKIFREHGQQEILLAILGTGDFFGEMALLERMPRSASATVVEEAELIEVDSQTFDDMLKNNRDITLRIMRSLAARVRSLGDRVHRLSVSGGIEAMLEWLQWIGKHGKLDKGWLRLLGAGSLDFATQTGVSADDAAEVEEKLMAYQCFHRDGEDLLIADDTHLDRVAHFLRLKRRFEGSAVESNADVQARHDLMVSSFLGHFHLDEAELSTTQAALIGEREEYLELKRHFEGAAQ